VVVGAGSFGTAVAVLLARGGFRTTLQTRTAEQCARLEADRDNRVYLPGVELPRELLAAGVPAAEIPGRIGQAVEALDLVPLLAHALQRAQIDAPVTDALNRLISGELPLDDWVARVRATVPPPARFGSVVAWARWRQRTKARFTRRRGSS
jgi:glycerol-3-phosphate dehydrogenase